MDNMHKNWIAAVLVMALSAAIFRPAGAAEQNADSSGTAEQQIDIPAGTLGTALARLGRELGMVVNVDPALVRGRQSERLRGSYSPDAAFAALLANSGLIARSDGVGGYRVVSGSSGSETTTAAPTSSILESEMEQVVVVGALTSETIGRKDIEGRQVNDLADLFRYVPSVSVGGSVSVAQKIYVRGLEDHLLNITVDGAPQRGTLFHHIGRVSIEPELLKTVEVQTGAGEASSGFGAIGGAIRFKTVDAADLLAEGQRFGGLARAGYFSNDGYKLSGSLFGRLAGETGFLASVVHTERDDFEDGDGQRVFGTGAKQQLGFLKIGGPVGDSQRFSVSYEHRKEEASFGQRPNWPALDGDALFPAQATRSTAVLNHGIDANEALTLETTGYWTQSEFIQDRYDSWGRYGAEITSFGFDVRAHLDWSSHRTVFGVEHRDDEVASAYLEDPAIWADGAWDPAIGRFVERGKVFGIYLQDRWQIADPLLLSYGARYDSYDLEQVTYDNGSDSDGVSLNAGLSYTVATHWILNGSFAQAFRGKEIGDAFTLEKRPGRISLAPALDPERVTNREIGVEYDNEVFRVSAVYYRTKIDDVILDQLGNGPPPQAPVYYENVGSFRAHGVELQAGYRTGAFSIDAYFNRFRSRLNDILIEGYEHIGLGNSVGNNWALTLGYRPTSAWSFQTSVTRFEDLNDIEVLQRGVEIGWIDETQFVDKPGYTLVDVFGNWRPVGKMDLALGIYNLFDERFRAHASVADYNHIPDWEGIAGVYEPGRNIRLTASIRF
jgi:hemoglobin/transferrin/lactoferrin receptor protein